MENMRPIEEIALNVQEYQFQVPLSVELGEPYHGKVRDVYQLGEKHLIMIASDRISAFDHVLPRPIPYKGRVLNSIASEFLRAASDIVPTWLLDTPHPNVSIGYRCEPIKLEMVIRGYLAGHAWREYKTGKRTICGVAMPEGMQEADPFPTPIITPATKAEEGHDEDISREEILSKNIVSKEVLNQLEDYTQKLFQLGTEMARDKGLILVDTKYEFGIYDGKIMLMDEIHTPDSSRFYYEDGYDERQKNGEPQIQLSKEFVREWLMSEGFQGKEGQVMPEMSDEVVWEISHRYVELYNLLSSRELDKEIASDEQKLIEQSIEKWITKNIK